MEAYRDRGQYRGSTAREEAAWLRKILTNTIVDHERRFLARRRDVSLECCLEGKMKDSSALLSAMALSDETQMDRLMQEEVSIQVAQALSRLPPLQYESIVRHHLEGEPVSSIARDLDSTVAAIAGHLRRGLAQLRRLLDTGGNRAS
jgi:RNA polymerase sigma factor (sigma-70 family)